ncbi:MAG: vanadium-dependent haloperoxidase [Gemmatimonadales bacterium]
MRFSTRLLMLPALIGCPGLAVLEAQVKPASATAEIAPVSARWNRLVPKFADEAAASRKAARQAAAGDSAALRRIAMAQPPLPFRTYTLLSVAQYAAVNSARDKRDVSSDAAVASASAAVIAEMYPDSTVRASIFRELARDLDKVRAASRGQARATAGGSLGEDIAHRVIAWAPTFNLVAPWKGTIPTGPGMWYSARGIPPIGVTLTTARTWVLDSAAQFRPAPPPSFDSPVFKAALEEVRRVARERTPEQTKVAQKWNDSDPWTMWNQTAVDAIRRNHMSDAQAARVLAVLNVAAMDAVVACFEAKYHYWTIRPSQADTTLVLADSVGLPNFPSFPSGHACSAGAFDAALGNFFPGERTQITRIAEEQAMSRLYGGIHYRYDNDGGLELGRVIARYVVAREKQGALNGWRSAPVARKP